MKKIEIVASMMTKIDMIEMIIHAKNIKELSWEDLAEQVGVGPVSLTSACLGMNSLNAEYARKLCMVLGLGSEVSKALQASSDKKRVWPVSAASLSL